MPPNAGPRRMTSRYAGRCTCGARVAEGSTILYAKPDGVVGCGACKADLQGVPAATTTRLQVVVRTVQFARDDGFAIVKVRIEGAHPTDAPVRKDQEFGVLGRLGSVERDDTLEVSGCWAQTPKYGWQFNARTAAPIVEATERSLVAFLRRLPGIGPSRAAQIMRHFGDRNEVLRILAEEPARLAEVSGVTQAMATEIGASYRSSKDLRSALLFLSDLGLGEGTTAAILEQWGADAHARIAEDPYSLMEIRSIGFKKADEIARKLGLSPVDARRCVAGAEHILEVATEQGHTWTPTSLLVGTGDGRDRIVAAARETGLTAEQIRLGLKALAEPSKRTVKGRSVLRPPRIVTCENDGVALSRVYGAECKIAGLLAERAAQTCQELKITGDLLEGLHEHQAAAVHAAAKSNVVVVTGGPGTGKCVVGQSLVLSSRGLTPIVDLAPRGLAADEATGLRLAVPTTTEGTQDTSHIYYGGLRKTIKLRTARGFEVEGTLEHPVWTATREGPTWRRLDELVPGDYIGIHVQAHEGGKERLDADLAYLLGALIADGTLSQATPIITKSDTDWLKRLGEFARLHLGAEPRIGVSKERTANLYLNGGRAVGARLLKLDVPRCTAAGKYIPSSVLRASAEAWRAFLRGLFDGDGAVDKHGCIELITASERLGREVQTLLSACGVWCGRLLKLVLYKGERRPYWRIKISGDDVGVFRERIGLTYNEKAARLSATAGTPRNTNIDVVPNAGNLIRVAFKSEGPQSRREWYRWKREISGERQPSRKRVRELLAARPNNAATEALTRLSAETVRWDHVAAVEVLETLKPVYDLTVPKGQSFVANGIYVHNTTSVKHVLDLFQQNGINIQCCAPTGKAAIRMCEQTGRPAATIHRLLGLGFGSDDDEFAPTSDKPLLSGAVVLDETSMVSIDLMSALLERLAPDARLVIVGDVDQLPSIGPGAVLRDIIDSGVVPVARLTKIFRQASESRIPYLARDINTGIMPDLSAGNDVFFVESSDPAEICTTIVQATASLIPERRQIKSSDVQVLSPKRKGDIGVEALSLALQAHLNPARAEDTPEVRINGAVVRAGDKVLHTANNYELSVMNGEIGVVERVAPDGLDEADLDAENVWTSARGRREQAAQKSGEVTDAGGVSGEKTAKILAVLNFGDRRVGYTRSELYQLDLGYCISVHKCVAPETLVETPKGLLRIEQLEPLKSGAVSGVVATPTGPKRWAGFVHDACRARLRITTEQGYSIIVTPDHGMDVWTDAGYARQEAQALQVGDRLRLRLGTTCAPADTPALPPFPTALAQAIERYQPVASRGRCRTPRTLTPEVAELLGVLVADGALFQRGFRVAKRHKDFVDHVEALCIRLFGTRTKRFKIGVAHCVEVCSVVLRQWLREIGGMEPNDKKVPDAVMQAPLNVQAAFLRGLFADATVNKRGHNVDHIEWGNCGESTCQTVQTMLLRFGIVASQKAVKRGPHVHHRLYIYSDGLRLFAKQINFIERMKRARLRLPTGENCRYSVPLTVKELRALRPALAKGAWGYARTRGQVPRRTLVAALSRVTLPLQRELAARLDFHHVRIRNIELLPPGPMMCLAVPTGSQFLQNGFAGWNCQGSQSKAIIVPVHRSHSFMLTRALIYTAVTRAEQFLLLVGESAAIAQAVQVLRGSDRRTLLRDRLRTASEASKQARTVEDAAAADRRRYLAGSL